MDGEASHWALFKRLDALPARFRERGKAIADQVDEALRRDDHVVDLVTTLKACDRAALDLVMEAAGENRDADRPPSPPSPDERDQRDERRPSDRPPKTGSRRLAATAISNVLGEI